MDSKYLSREHKKNPRWSRKEFGSTMTLWIICAEKCSGLLCTAKKEKISQIELERSINWIFRQKKRGLHFTVAWLEVFLSHASFSLFLCPNKDSSYLHKMIKAHAITSQNCIRVDLNFKLVFVLPNPDMYKKIHMNGKRWSFFKRKKFY